MHNILIYRCTFSIMKALPREYSLRGHKPVFYDDAQYILIYKYIFSTIKALSVEYILRGQKS